MSLPKTAAALVEALVEADWSFIVNRGADTGGAPYITIEGWGNDREVSVTWHTRGTGTYRVFSCMARTPGNRTLDVTLTKAMGIVTEQAGEVAA